MISLTQYHRILGTVKPIIYITKMLGKGTFGEVTKEGNLAVKQFKKHSHLIQEVILTRYFKDSPRIVTCRGYNLKDMTMSTTLCDISLRDALLKYNFTYNEKMTILIGMLQGLDHIHSRNVIHADFKPSNILLNLKPLSVKICDMGLSSTMRYGKIGQTAIGYRLPKPMIDHKNGTYHDMYSLAILTIELFGGIRFEEQVYPDRLAEIVDETRISDINPNLAKGLKKCILRVKGKCEAYNLLNYLSNSPPPFPIPSIVAIDNKLSHEDTEYIHSQMRKLTSSVNAKRGKRGYYVLLDRINNPNCKPIPRFEFPLYIVAMTIILSSVFGVRGFDVEMGSESLEGKWSEDKILEAISSIIDCDELINFLMLH